MNLIWSCLIDREQRFLVFSSFVQIDEWNTLSQVYSKLKLIIIKQSFQRQPKYYNWQGTLIITKHKRNQKQK